MNKATPRPRASQAGLNAAIAATLNGERVAVGMTFDELADKTGISARSLKRYLSSADRDISIPILARLSVAMDLPVLEIVARAERRRNPPPTSPASSDTA